MTNPDRFTLPPIDPDVGMKEARRGYPCPVCNDPTE